MKTKLALVSFGLLLVGWGCNQPVQPQPVSGNTGIVPPAQTEDQKPVTSTVTATTTTDTKLVVARSFTLEEIEANGGLKDWFRDLARANVAGKKILVRVPVNRVFGFGCETPGGYCVSNTTVGCMGPYLDLEGETLLIERSNQKCDQVCNSDLDPQDPAADAISCSTEFRNSQCSTLWDVEGYVTAASRIPEVSGEEGGSCSAGELMYDFKVTRVINKIEGGYDDEFEFVEYSPGL